MKSLLHRIYISTLDHCLDCNDGHMMAPWLTFYMYLCLIYIVFLTDQ